MPAPRLSVDDPLEWHSLEPQQRTPCPTVHCRPMHPWAQRGPYTWPPAGGAGATGGFLCVHSVGVGCLFIERESSPHGFRPTAWVVSMYSSVTTAGPVVLHVYTTLLQLLLGSPAAVACDRSSRLQGLKVSRPALVRSVHTQHCQPPRKPLLQRAATRKASFSCRAPQVRCGEGGP